MSDQKISSQLNQLPRAGIFFTSRFTISVLPLPVLAFLLLCCFACRDNATGPGVPNAMLTADVEVTDVLLTIHLVPGMQQQQGTLTLTRNDSVIASFVNPLSDTTFLDNRLHPNTSYVYESRFVSDMFPFGSSSGPVAITTLDTTSQEIIWQMDTLGAAGSSILYDVTIINDTLVYAVGAMYFLDSTGQWKNPPYNLAKWNGQEWQLQTITYVYQGRPTYVPLQWIFALNDHDIWFGGSVHWDGHGLANVDIPVFYGIKSNKMWGTPSGQLYVIGNTGTLAYSPDHGASWQKLETSTTLDIQDIWGAQTKTGEWEILAVAGNYYESSARKILKITGTTVTTLSDSGMNDAPNSVWFSPAKRYWIAGNGVWDKRFTLAKPTWTQEPATIYSTNRIRGTDINNVFFCGAYGDMLHFNGSSWQGYRAQTHISDGLYISIAVKNDCVFAVGIDNPGAVVARGYIQGTK